MGGEHSEIDPRTDREVATLAGGCFWCLEAVFDEVKGVERVVSGYSGGTVANPSYSEVCAGRTGHAEAVQVTFDPSVISFKDILGVFFAITVYFAQPAEKRPEFFQGGSGIVTFFPGKIKLFPVVGRNQHPANFAAVISFVKNVPEGIEVTQ